MHCNSNIIKPVWHRAGFHIIKKICLGHDGVVDVSVCCGCRQDGWLLELVRCVVIVVWWMYQSVVDVDRTGGCWNW